METTVRHFNRTEKQYQQVPCPDVIKAYNKGMGGMDLLDNMVTCYR